MRKSFSLVVVLLALVAITKQGCCTDGCFSIVNGAQAQGEALVKTALNTDSKSFNPAGICGATFASKGSCCDPKSVGAYADKLLGRLKQIFKGVESAISQAPAIFRALPALVEILKSKDPTGTTTDELFMKSVGGIDGYLKLNAIVQALNTRSAAVQTQLASAASNNAKCYNALFQARINSLCMVCAGDADTIFNTLTQRFRVKTSFCQTLVTECSSVMDLFVKVSHALEASRVIRNALSSTNVQRIAAEFSDDRVSLYEDCAKNPTACNQDFVKLARFCKDVSVIRDPKVVTLTENKVSDASAISTDATTNFKASVTKEGDKLTAAIQEKSTLAQAFNPTAPTSVQGLLTTADTSATASKTEADKLRTAQTNLQTATTTDLVQKATARKTSINALITARKASYTLMSEVLNKYVTALQADLPTSPDFNTASQALTAASKLLTDVQKAATMTTDFEKVKDAYYVLETASLATSPPKLPEPNQIVPFETQMTTWNKFDADIQTRFPAVKTAAQSYADLKKAEIDASILKATAAKVMTSAKVDIATFQNSLDTTKTELATTQRDLSTASQLKQTLTNIDTKLENPPAVRTVSDVITATTNTGTSATTSKSKLATLSSAIGTTAAGTSPTTGNPIKDLANTETTRITAELTALAQPLIDCDKPFSDAFATELGAGITQTQAQINTLNTDIMYISGNTTAAENAIKTSQAKLQPVLTNTMTAKAAWEAVMIQVNNVKLNIIKIEGDLATATKDIRADISTTQASLDYTNEVKTAKCSSTASGTAAYSQTYCAELATKATTLQSTLATLQQNLASTSQQFNSQLATQRADLTKQLPNLEAAQSRLDLATAAAKAENTIIEQSKATIRTLTDSLRTKQAALAAAQAKVDNDQKLLDTYSTKAASAAVAAFNTRCEITRAQKAVLDLLKGLYTQIVNTPEIFKSGSNEIDRQATYGKFVPNITGLTSNCTAQETKVAESKVALEASRVTLQTTVVDMKNAVKTDLTTQVTKEQTLTASQTTLQTEVTRLQGSITTTTTASTQPPRRMLQTVSDEGDIDLDDGGADPNTDYKAGVTVDGGLDSQTTYADTAALPANSPTTTTTNTPSGDQASGNSAGLLPLGCMLTIATFYLNSL